MASKRGAPPGPGATDPEHGSEFVAGLWELLEAEQNSGYPPLEAVPDADAKAAQEVSDCEDFATELRIEFGIPLRDIDNNPKNALPDCIGMLNGQRVGIEVTRLTITPEDIAWQRNCLRSNITAFCSVIEKTDPVRAEIILNALVAKPFKFAKVLKHIPPHEQVLVGPPWPEWPFDYFQKRLRAAIREKENIAANRAEKGKLGEFAKLVLLVRTHEYNLSEDRVGKYLQQVDIPALRHFDAAYLKLPTRAMDGPGRHSCPVFRIPA